MHDVHHHVEAAFMYIYVESHEHINFVLDIEL